MAYSHVTYQSTFESLDTMWVHALRELFTRGQETPSRDGYCTELLGFSGTLANCEKTFLLNPVRLADPIYAAAETLWYLSGRAEVEMLLPYAKSYAKFAEPDGKAHGAYGARWLAHDQLRRVINVLRLHPESRQAIMTMWSPTDLPHAEALDKRDLPCTISMQFIIRDRRLHLIVNMRSNDIWLGMPYDVFAFTTVQRFVAMALDLEPGTYTHQAGSLHLYSRNEDKAEDARFVNSELLAKFSHRYPAWPTSPWNDLDLALRIEESARLHSPEPSALQEGSFLGDLAQLCKEKFVNNYGQRVFSPLLRKALSQKRSA